MAGIKPVMYNGVETEITAENAKELLIHRDECGMTTSQIKYAESFISEEERDEIFYSDAESTKRGQDAMSLDADGDGKNDIEAGDEQKGGGAAAGMAGTAVATGAAGFGVLIQAALNWLQDIGYKGQVNGFWSIVAGAALVAGSALALVSSFANVFDKGFDTRKAFSEATGNNTGTMDAKGEELVGNMDLMNEDAALYQEQCDAYTEATGEATSEMASLQIALADAQSMGDQGRVKELQEQIEALKETDFSDMEDGLQETRDKMGDYNSQGVEAQGMTENGNTIAEFLDVGGKMKTYAMINAIGLTLLVAALGISAAIAGIPKVWAGPVPIDSVPAVAGAVLYGVATAMLAVAAGKMYKNMSDEGKFEDSGQQMHDHIDTLNETIGEHTDYMEEINGAYDDMDEEAEAEQEENGETATGSVEKKSGDNTSVRLGGLTLSKGGKSSGSSGAGGSSGSGSSGGSHSSGGSGGSHSSSGSGSSGGSSSV